MTLTPNRLRCAHLINPLGVSPARVRLSWMLDGTGTGRRQHAYQILMTADATSPATGIDPWWDSGRVEASGSADVPYVGPALASGTRYTWRVRVWDENAMPSRWSDPAWFEIELDQATDWKACWIGLGPISEPTRPPAQTGPPDPVAKAMNPAPYLRREFEIDGTVTSARLHVTALGLYEARLNGHRVGDSFLTPGWTDYDRRVSYQTYDVTGLMAQGPNVLGAILADGWYAGYVGYDAKRAGAHYGSAPELLAQLSIRFRDGTSQLVVTDGRWLARTAAIRSADLLMGETHDLRLEHDGWDASGFDAAGWFPVRCRGRDSRLLVADPGPPVRVTTEVTPRSITLDAAGRHIVDFGQNLTGWLKVHIGPTAPERGLTVRIRHGEMLSDDGGLYTDNLRTARQSDEFTLECGPATLEPRFTLHGFRYAEITGYPGELDPSAITARVIHSDLELAGSFSSSQPWLDQLHRNIDWGQRGNFISVPTDCPQRDERLGWLGDAQIFARTACYNRDVAAFFGKWLDDVADAQLLSGAFTDIAPRLHLTSAGAPAWGDAGVIVPWTVWKMYGDSGILERHFDAMTAWMDFIEQANPDYLRARKLGNSYNDWLAPVDDHTPRELLATAYWAYDAALMAEIADAIGRPGEAAGYRALRSKIQSAFAEAFVAGDGQLASGTQTAYVLGLHMDLVPERLRAAAADRLVAAIRQADWHLTTGFVGVGYILPVLSGTGHTAAAYRLLEQESPPSWRYMVNQGATTIWERWDGWTADRGFQSAWMNSFNHYALGSVGEWLYRFVLGIDQETGTTGFGQPVIRPHPGGQLRWAQGSYRSASGPIAVSWHRADDRFTLRVRLPPNTSGSVRVPSDDPHNVCDAEGNPPSSVGKYPGAWDVQEAVFFVGSGVHEFSGPGHRGTLLPDDRKEDQFA